MGGACCALCSVASGVVALFFVFNIYTRFATKWVMDALMGSVGGECGRYAQV